MIPITKVVVNQEMEDLVLEVLRSGVLAQGPRVAEFENLFAEVCGVKHAIAVNNGTTALIAALRTIPAPFGSTLITSPFTFVATLNAALDAGFKVRFADVDEQTFNVTAESIEDVADEKTKVVMPVHLYGQCAHMTSISDLARSKGWEIVEDAAQAHGAKHAGRTAGSFGTGCFSFYATKNISTGEGGMITTNDDDLADRLRVYRNQGMRQRYQYEMAGNNFRLTDLQAALGIPQLRRIEAIIARRQENAKLLSGLLQDVPGLVTPVVADGNSHVWHQYTIRVTDEARISRDELVEKLGHREIGCGIYYPRIANDYDCFRSHPLIEMTETPVARRLVNEVVSLPVHQFLEVSEIERVAAAVKECVLG